MVKFTSRQPREGEYFTIKSYKHDGHLHRTWRETMVLKTSENAIIGINNHTLVTEDDGRKWVTHEPAIVYFHKKLWFNVIAMIRKDGIAYYSNLASPFVMDKEALKYIDYDLDIKVTTEGNKILLDADEYIAHSELWDYPDDTKQILEAHVKILKSMIENREGPFSNEFINLWYSRYETILEAQERESKEE
jgi:protein associated with RNAse G/E